jgi:hypothetical protein
LSRKPDFPALSTDFSLGTATEPGYYRQVEIYGAKWPREEQIGMLEPISAPSLPRFLARPVAISDFVPAWLTLWAIRRKAAKTLWRAIRAA